MGHRILIEARSEILRLAAVIALTHHEWYDGTGYPQGLEGGDIPLVGRIAAIADVFDALTTDRPYRSALSAAQACETMSRERGSHFEPALLDLFFDLDPSSLLAINSLVALRGEEATDREARMDALAPRAPRRSTG